MFISILMSAPCLIFSSSPYEIFTVYFSSIQLKRIIIGNSTFRVNFNAAAECCVKKFWNSPNGANRNSPNSRESFSKSVCWKIAVAVISETFRKCIRTYYSNWYALLKSLLRFKNIQCRLLIEPKFGFKNILFYFLSLHVKKFSKFLPPKRRKTLRSY